MEVKINETEMNNVYHAFAYVDGVLHERTVMCDPVAGWPPDYKQKARDEIRAAVEKNNA